MKIYENLYVILLLEKIKIQNERSDAEKLIQHADINATDKNGHTLLMRMLLGGDSETALMLLKEQGIETNKKNRIYIIFCSIRLNIGYHI